MPLKFNSSYPVGYDAIIQNYQLQVIPHFISSYITDKTRTYVEKGNYHECVYYPKSQTLKDPDNPLSQLEFAVKHEGINLTIMKLMFQNIEPSDVSAYVSQRPTGIYTRKIWYLYEMLTSNRLNLPDSLARSYVELLDKKQYYTGVKQRSSRHKVIDNLLGDINFCPMIRRTEKIDKYKEKKLNKAANEVISQYDPSIVARAISYLYTKETMSSYAIERERPNKRRLSKYVELLRDIGQLKQLTKDELIILQNEIMSDPRFYSFNYRDIQNYVGESLGGYREKIHYICPKPEDVSDLMQGLLASLDKMFAAKLHPVLIAAAVSFGFVFIHPFDDGNGRLHRLLIHYVLSKGDFTPDNAIFPVSAVMLKNMRGYDLILESFSKPLKPCIKNYVILPDGQLIVRADTKIHYQYIDFTHFAEYLFECIQQTIETDFKEEIEFLIHYDKAKAIVQDIVEMPDRMIELIIKCVMQNNGKLSTAKRKKYFHMLSQEEIELIERSINDLMLNNS